VVSGVLHVNPSVLVLFERQPAGNSGREVYAGGVANLPAELVLSVVVVIEIGRLSLGLAAREAPPHISPVAGLPVIVPSVPGADLFDLGLGPALLATADADVVTPRSFKLLCGRATSRSVYPMYWVAKTLHLTPEPEAWKAVDSSALAPFAETATKRSSPSGALNAEASIQELNSDDLTYLTSPPSLKRSAG